jgi:hypothetical protein
MKNLWYGTAVAAATFCGALIGADALRSNGNAHYSFWVSPLAFYAYVTVVIAVICLMCGLFNICFPDLDRARPLALGEHELIQIKKISDESGYTRAQKRPLYDPYLGRRIQISGTMIDVREWTGSSSRMTMRTDVGEFAAFMNFSDRSTYDQQLMMLAPRAHVTVIGEIKEIEGTSIVLVNCEIVREGSGRSPVV